MKMYQPLIGVFHCVECSQQDVSMNVERPVVDVSNCAIQGVVLYFTTQNWNVAKSIGK